MTLRATGEHVGDGQRAVVGQARDGRVANEGAGVDSSTHARDDGSLDRCGGGLRNFIADGADHDLAVAKVHRERESDVRYRDARARARRPYAFGHQDRGGQRTRLSHPERNGGCQNVPRASLQFCVRLARERPRRESRVRKQRPLRRRLLGAHGVVNLVCGNRSGSERRYDHRYGHARAANPCDHGSEAWVWITRAANGAAERRS